MNSKEIRQSYLDFFKNKQHHIVPSAPVVPQDDPTLIFINAGMNQYKDIFLGIRKKQHPRIADSQKCIRVSGKHNDLEEVGRDTYHHTFFEMLGNWSFGDYFKAEAIRWAWELFTDVWKLPKDKLWATVFEGDQADGVGADEEAENEWKKQTDIDHSHILRCSKKDNFWEMGETGPCGPCSEIHIDLGPTGCDSKDPNHECKVNGDCARYIELWNLVFIQYYRDETGKLNQLPDKHVDTGAGFERIVAVMQNKKSNYDTDLFMPIINEIAQITGKPYSDGEDGVAFRVLSDHIRALSFAIADGAIPGNEGRGYVLRRILRRAARFGRVLGMQEPFFYKLVSPLVTIMGEAYPELKERHQYIARVIKAEEESFGRTLDRGIEIFEQKANALTADKKTVFAGQDAFLLHDTYGFPLDLTELMAEEKGLSVDNKSFNKAMAEQRERSSKSRDIKYATVDISSDEKGSEFIGYNEDEANATIVHFQGDQLVLSETPFYAESGGQLGDAGVIKNANFEFKVSGTKNIGEHIVHFGEIVSGIAPHSGDKVVAVIDQEKRRSIERNHTVTHLAHQALRTVLGDHVHQAGSMVHPDYMRFDFTHFEKVSADDLQIIEEIVNSKILNNMPVEWTITNFDAAKKSGAMALFGEKYGDEVRMVEIADYSKELCGGTHVRATGEIGDFVIVSESAVAAGIRRIETVTGFAAQKYLRSRAQFLDEAAKLLNCQPAEVTGRIDAMLKERKTIEQELTQLRQHRSQMAVADIFSAAEDVNGIKVVAAEIQANNIDELKKAGDLLRDKIQSGVGVLGAVIGDKVNFVCIVTQDVIKDRGIIAGDVVKKVASFAGGGGGGSPHMATAGAKQVENLGLALSKVSEIVAEF
jgi:alanyl-tRNA synthetase